MRIFFALILFANVATAQSLLTAQGLATFASAADEGGSSPGTDGLVAWYDFAGSSEALGSYDLSEQNAPTYSTSPTRGISTAGSPGSYWWQTLLDNNFGNVSDDWSFVIRFKWISTPNANEYVLNGNGGRTFIRADATGNFIEGRLGNVIVTSSTEPAADTWFTCLVTHSSATATTSISVNGSTLESQTGTASYAVGTIFFGGSGSSASFPFEIDYAGFWSKQLTQNNATWLSGGTRNYSDL